MSEWADPDEIEVIDSYSDEVLDLVALIPPGQVSTYGDLAELVGRGGPRQVGRVLAGWGGSVPWWRVVRADGRPAAGHEADALRRLGLEQTPLRAEGTRVDLRLARWLGPEDDPEMSSTGR